MRLKICLDLINLYKKFKIETNTNEIKLKFDKIAYKSWHKLINLAIKNSPWSHRLERFVEASFSPIRQKNTLRLMIDGEMYFRRVGKAIE